MDIIFNCEHCEQELSVDASGTGSEIECPSCGERIVIPSADQARTVPHPVNPIASSAAAKEEKHFKVPHHEKPPESLIEKPRPPLEAAAKETDKQLRVKTLRHSDCVEVGKDHFDEAVTRFLGQIGEDNVVSITPITYTHQDLASRAWITDYGVLVLYKG